MFELIFVFVVRPKVSFANDCIKPINVDNGSPNLKIYNITSSMPCHGLIMTALQVPVPVAEKVPVKVCDQGNGYPPNGAGLRQA